MTPTPDPLREALEHGIREVGGYGLYCLCGEYFRLPSQNHGSVEHTRHNGEIDSFNAHLAAALSEPKP